MPADLAKFGRGGKYGLTHRRLRAEVGRMVAAGNAACARCGFPISPSEPWDLGHDDLHPDRWSGPEHRRCNRATSGRRREYSRLW